MRRPLPVPLASPVTLALPSLLAIAALAACGAEAPPDDDDPLPPPAPGEGFQLAMAATVPAGTEVWLCDVSELPTTDFTRVGRVRSVQTDRIHHMDVSALAFAGLDLPVGRHDCGDVYRDHPELMEQGLILYAAQQADQEIVLPPGTVANLPPGLKVMQELHFVNAAPEPAEVFSKLNVYRYPGRVEQEIWGGAVRDLHLEIPPGDHVEWTRCVMNQPVDVLFLTSHTHELARTVEIRAFDGVEPGALLYENTDWHAPPLHTFAPEALHVPAGHGFEFTCHYRNPGPDTVRWGFAATDEMCQIALVFTPGEASRRCEIVATSDGLGVER